MENPLFPPRSWALARCRPGAAATTAETSRWAPRSASLGAAAPMLDLVSLRAEGGVCRFPSRPGWEPDCSPAQLSRPRQRGSRQVCGPEAPGGQPVAETSQAEGRGRRVQNPGGSERAGGGRVAPGSAGSAFRAAAQRPGPHPERWGEAAGSRCKPLLSSGGGG